MKTFRNYLMMLGVALFAVLAAGCTKDSEGELDPFVQVDNPADFVNSYKRSKKALLVDVRSPETYAKGHLDGAVNIPVMDENGRVNAKYLDPDKGGTWGQDLVAAVGGDKSTTLYIYGNESFTYTRSIAGHASKAGFGKEHTFIYVKKYDALVNAWNK